MEAFHVGYENDCYTSLDSNQVVETSKGMKFPRVER